MTSKNIFNILVIFIMIGFIIYSFYNCNQIQTTSDYSVKPKSILNESYGPTTMNSSPKKKVSFNPNIQYYNYESHSPPKFITKSAKMDKIPKIDNILKENESTPKINLAGNIIPSNFDIINPNQQWDSSFGLPLMDKKEQAAFFAKMMDNYGKYTDTLDKFGQYVTDQSTIIKTETTIDPFKPTVRSAQLAGKTVQEIYDEQVRGPQAIPKKIKARTDHGIVYQNESELNGGKMRGTDLVGVNQLGDTWESAAFGNGF